MSLQSALTPEPGPIEMEYRARQNTIAKAIECRVIAPSKILELHEFEAQRIEWMRDPDGVVRRRHPPRRVPATVELLPRVDLVHDGRAYVHKQHLKLVGSK